MNRENLVIFDAAGTLFDTLEPVESVYSRTFAKFGYEASAADWQEALGQAFNQISPPAYMKHETGDIAERAWWRMVVERAAEDAGLAVAAGELDVIFEELFRHYSSGAAWQLFADTKEVLGRLKEEGYGLAIASNFDSRLHRVVSELGIDQLFDEVLTSASVQSRKPGPEIIRKILEKFSVKPDATCLVGDSLHFDQGAADAAGISFFHLDRPRVSLGDFEKWWNVRFLRK